MALLILAYVLLIVIDNALPILKRHENGSYVDLDARRFVYWDGPRPAERRRIELDKISEIRISEFIADDELVAIATLIDVDDNEIQLPGHCLNQSFKSWAKIVSENFPAIKVVHRS